jgi:hypothetical protein
MDDARFDALTRALAGTTRRGVTRLLAAATLGVLSREAAGAKHTGCRHHGKPCKRDKQCCSGRCSRRRHRCTCPGETTKCGKTACCRTADQTCCGGTCAPGLLNPEGGSCPGDPSTCCPGLTCTPNDSTCCRPENVCFKACCLNGTRCTNEDVCCASGNSCNGVCCSRTNDICTIGDLECCRPENVCHRSCCNPLRERCDGLNCVPIVIGPASDGKGPDS